MFCRFFVIFICTLPSFHLAKAQENPGEVMQSFIEDVQTIWVPLNRQEGASYDSRRAWTREVVSTRFDVPQMAKSSLGTQWRTLSEDQQATYTEYFFDLLVETVIDWLRAYDGQTFEILSVREAGRNTEILTRFEQLDGRIVKATWVTRASNEIYLIRDVRVSGISLTADFRGRHQNALNKGGIEGLFAFLQTDIDRLQSQNQ